MISTMFTNMLKLTVPAPLTLSHKNTLNITFWIFSLANAPSGRVTRTGVKSKTAAQLVLKHDNINTRNKIPNRASAFPPRRGDFIDIELMLQFSRLFVYS